MNVLFWCAVGALLIAMYVSALTLALRGYSRSALERRLAENGRSDRGEWLAEHLDDTVLAISLIRTVARIAFFVFVLVQFAGIGESAVLTVKTLLMSTGVSILCVWLMSTVLASALARYASLELILPALPALRIVALVLTPVTRTCRVVDEVVKRLTGANLREGEEAEQELLRSIEDSRREGGLDQESAALLENVVEFRRTDVGEVMTPRTDIDAIEMTDNLAEIRGFIARMRHSRIPVYRENVDNIVGILYVKDLIHYIGEDASDFKLEPILRSPIVVPETKSVPSLLADFQRSEVHMAIVIDEYGGTAGLVTIEDVLEEIVGEIKDEHDPDHIEEPAMQRVADLTVEVDGRYHIDDLNAELQLELPEDDEYDTVGGFLLAQFGRVPQTGESIEVYNARFTTVVASPTHIERIAIELLEAPSNGWTLSTQDPSDAA
ncbi:MAG: HlyC/CorC family transporter [Phycisphaerales bacterium]|nr:HlyC/CorC family transporter [Phycisphaerales bacterium]